MKTAIAQKLEKAVRQAMQKHPVVISAYLFGSVAAGFAGQRSDVDIAVRIDEGLAPDEVFDLRLQLAAELEGLIDRSVDVIVLNTASLKMIHQVMKTGQLVYTTNPNKETAFRLQKQKEYFDFQYYMEDDRKSLKAFFG